MYMWLKMNCIWPVTMDNLWIQLRLFSTSRLLHAREHVHFNIIQHSYYLCFLKYLFKCISYYVEATCPELSLENGQITYDPLRSSSQSPVDSVASFECDYGYKLHGSSSTTCQTSGTWSEQTPKCIQGTKLHITMVSVDTRMEISLILYIFR